MVFILLLTNLGIALCSQHEETDGCGFPLCEQRLINTNAPGFFTDASTRPEKSSMALKGTWKPRIKREVSWYAGISGNGTCRIDSVSFMFKNSDTVIVSEVNRSSLQTVENTVIMLPSNSSITDLHRVGSIKIGADVEMIQVTLLSSDKIYRPELSKVKVITCCNSIKFCPRFLVNAEVVGLQTNSKPISNDFTLALNGVWDPGFTSTVFWFAEIPENGDCKIYSIEFYHRGAKRVYVHETTTNNLVKTVKILRNTEAENNALVATGEIMFGENVTSIFLQLEPINGKSIQLAMVNITHCCQEELPPCMGAKQNEDIPGLVVNTTVNMMDARNAFQGTDQCWATGTTNVEYWLASVPEPTFESSCYLYAMQFEVANTFEVFVNVQSFTENSTRAFLHVITPDENPGGVRWWRVEKHVFSGEDTGNIQLVALQIWSGLNITELVMPIMRNVILTACCA